MSSCPILTKNELNIQVSNDNSGVKTVGDVIKKMKKATSNSKKSSMMLWVALRPIIARGNYM